MGEQQNYSQYMQRTAKVLDILQKYQLPPTGPIGLGQQPKFQERVVSRAVEKASSITDEEKGALYRLYGNELSALQIPASENGVSNLFESLFERLFDGGTSKDRVCDMPYEGKTEEFREPAVPILTRSAFITRVLDEHAIQNEKRDRGGDKDYDVSIGLIDLHNLRGADFYVEGQPDKPADVLVNKAARAIRTAFRKLGYTDKERLAKEVKSWELGRYGGDEFVFGLFGHFTEEERSRLYMEINKELYTDENMSFYQYTDADGGKVIKKERILLKEVGGRGDCVEEIRFPADEKDPDIANKRLMFKEYLQRGLLLTESEFAKIIAKYSPRGTFDFTLYRGDYPDEKSYYPEEITTASDRIEYIKKQHPELAFYFDLAEIMDIAASPTCDERRHILLETIENSLFDRLIGEAIYSREQFQKFLVDREFGSMITVDLKFIKEINETMSYADADMAIKEMWEVIKGSLSPEDRQKVMIGRFGGTFALGIRKGMDLDDRSLLLLKTIQGLNFGTPEKAFTLPVSVTERVALEPDAQSEPIKSPEAVFGNVLSENETKFYRLLLLDIMAEELYSKKPERFLRHLKKTSPEEAKKTDGAIRKENLYTLFLKGKRKIERLEKLRTAYAKRYSAFDEEDSIDIKGLTDDLNQYAKDMLFAPRFMDIPPVSEDTVKEKMLQIQILD